MEDRNHHNFEIRRILSEYEAPYEPGAWERFEQKRQRKRRWAVWYRVAGMAASLSLIALAALMRYDILPGSSPETIISHKKISKDTLEQTVNGIPDNAPLASAETLLPQHLGSGNKNKISGTKYLSKEVPGNAAVALPSTAQPHTHITSVEQGLPPDLSIDKVSRLGISVTLPVVTISSLSENRFHPAQTSEEEAWVIQQNLEELKTETKKKPLLLGVTLSSLMSSTPQASSSQLRVGGGLTAEIPFNDKLALYTGVHLSNQTLTSEVNEDPTILSGSKALQSVTIDLLSLDIPINVRYTFSEQKDNAMYVAAGLSSLAYLGEKTESEFLVPSTIITFQEAENGEIIEVYETVQMSATEVMQSSAFEQFDLAGQLNLSFGYSYKLNGQWRLVVEPYYKHPLSKLSSSELSFSTAGVNLRLNFGIK